MLDTVYICPHPPIVVPEVGGGEEEKIRPTLDSFKRMTKEIANFKPETIIITSPHQLAYMDGFYVANADRAYGDLRQFGADVSIEKKYDKTLASLIAENANHISHLNEDTATIDHGSFVPLYFIEQLYKNYELVLIGISGLSAKNHYDLGVKIQEAVEKSSRRAIMIASGDLSHALKDYGPYGYKEEGEVFDNTILDILERADLDSLTSFDDDLINAADQCGIKSFQIMTGVFDGCDVSSEKWSYDNEFGVGYGFFKLTRQGEKEISELNKNEDPYINLARLAIETYVKTGRRISIDQAPDEIKDRKAASFVTIYKNQALRGCIGTIRPVYENLADEIINNAISACSSDPRFSPVSEDELTSLVINVDVLGEMEFVENIDDLDPKRYGIVVGATHDNRRGLLLPDLDGVDTIEEQLEIALAKAGIDKSEPYQCLRFEVERHD